MQRIQKQRTVLPTQTFRKGEVHSLDNGLPSPPVDDHHQHFDKMSPSSCSDDEVSVDMATPSSSHDWDEESIRQKIKSLQEEKHRLFLAMKDLLSPKAHEPPKENEQVQPKSSTAIAATSETNITAVTTATAAIERTTTPTAAAESVTIATASETAATPKIPASTVTTTAATVASTNVATGERQKEKRSTRSHSRQGRGVARSRSPRRYFDSRSPGRQPSFRFSRPLADRHIPRY
ncbi:hypothetical protein EC973_001479 [Apophysomyces ossiformis]|uniref:Uncharacterized protein n=1 Tax=Apophysomyces ossiformis TaxID=679940 RepID=A0A8H7BNZ2_9FUNG|nr:hypothetical protein EC973_001479 [Apophysomyces ossiformis]